MVNQSKKSDIRYWNKWRDNGSVGDINGSAMGTAYAVFDLDASQRQITGAVVDEVKRLSRTMGNNGRLETALAEVKDIASEDSEISYFMQDNTIYPTFPSAHKDRMEGAKPIRMTDLKYALRIRRNGSDEKAANFASNVMNDVYQRYGGSNPFNVAVVYRNPEDGYLDFKRD